MKLSISIMAHPVRESFVHELQKSLGRTVPVAWDDEGPPSADKQRRWRTARRAWELHAPSADWHITLQDDAIVCRDFLSAVKEALAHVPGDGIVNTYWGEPWLAHRGMRALFQKAKMRRASWIGLDVVGSGVSIAAPVDTIPDMLKTCDQDTMCNYDARLGHYYHGTLGWMIWNTMPSLTDHRETESLVGHGSADRIAANFHRGSGLQLAWDRPSVTKDELL